MNLNDKKSNPLKILNNERGQGLAEYLILVLLVAIVSIGATRKLGSAISSRITAAKNQIQNLKAGAPSEADAEDPRRPSRRW